MKIYTDARDAIFGELYEIAQKDSNVILLTVDTGALVFPAFQTTIPNQFFNIGIAEQNAISVACGLASEGKKVFVYGITNFVTLRCLEQIRLDMCAMNLPITIIGSGTGYTYSSEGVTHHMTEDLSAMRALPNLSIFSPGDFPSCIAYIHKAYESKGPCYLRFDRGTTHDIFTTEKILKSGCNLAVTQVEGSGVVIIATGVMTYLAVFMACKLSGEHRYVDVIDVSQLKPFEVDRFTELIRPYSLLFTLEEHSLVGGLGSLVAETLVDNHIHHKSVYRLGIPDTYLFDVGSRDYLRNAAGIDMEQVLDQIRSHY